MFHLYYKYLINFFTAADVAGKVNRHSCNEDVAAVADQKPSQNNYD